MLLACTYVIKTKKDYETPDKGNLVALISLQNRKKFERRGEEERCLTFARIHIFQPVLSRHHDQP